MRGKRLRRVLLSGHAERSDVLTRHVLDVLLGVERTRPHLVVAARQRAQPQLPAPRPPARQPPMASAARGAPQMPALVHVLALAALRAHALRNRHLDLRDLAAAATVSGRPEDAVRPAVLEARFVARIAGVRSAGVTTRRPAGGHDALAGGATVARAIAGAGAGVER